MGAALASGSQSGCMHASTKPKLKFVSGLSHCRYPDLIIHLIGRLELSCELNDECTTLCKSTLTKVPANTLTQRHAQYQFPCACALGLVPLLHARVAGAGGGGRGVRAGGEGRRRLLQLLAVGCAATAAPAAAATAAPLPHSLPQRTSALAQHASTAPAAAGAAAAPAAAAVLAALLRRQ